MVLQIYVAPEVSDALWKTVLNYLVKSRQIKVTSDPKDVYDVVFVHSEQIPSDVSAVPIILAQRDDDYDVADAAVRIRRETGQKVEVCLPLSLESILINLERDIKERPQTAEERVVVLSSQLRYNLQVAESKEAEKGDELNALNSANIVFAQLYDTYIAPNSPSKNRKLIVPLGEVGKYTEGGAVQLGKTDLVFKRIESKGGHDAYQNAKARYEQTTKFRDAPALSPCTMYSPMRVGGDVWLVTEQVRGRTILQVLSLLADERSRLRGDPRRLADIDRVAYELMDAHVNSLLAWVQHAEPLQITPEELKKSYAARCEEIPKVLGKSFCSNAEIELWQRSIEALLQRMEIGDATLVPRRDAVWDNGLMRIEEAEFSLDTLLSVKDISNRYHSIDMGAEKDSVYMEVAKFSVDSTVNSVPTWKDYALAQAERVVKEVSKLKGFKPEGIGELTESLIYLHRALRQMTFCSGLFPERLAYDFKKWKGLGTVTTSEDLDRQRRCYRREATYCADVAERIALHIASQIASKQSGYYTPAQEQRMPLERIEEHQLKFRDLVRAIGNGKNKEGITTERIRIDRSGLYLGGKKCQKYLKVLDAYRDDGNTEKLTLASALIVASYINRFRTEKMNK